MTCEVIPLDLNLKRDFIVAGGRESLKHNYVFVIDGLGIGEAAGSVHYGATPAEINSGLMGVVEIVTERDIPISAGFFKAISGAGMCGPTSCAVSTAWHDLQAKRKGIPLYQHLELEPPSKLPTSITVSVGDIESIADQVDFGFKHIKLKMNEDKDLNNRIIDAIKNSKDVIFRIDANGSWSLDEAIRVVSLLPEDKVELIEQPFWAGAKEDWKRLKKLSSFPLIMDESIERSNDVKRAAEYVDGVNIKIQKSGRLETAIAAIATARELGLKIMIGCMIESSLGIATAYHLSGPADYLDLDGRLLIDSDPFTGLQYDGAELKITNDSGHGISFA